MIILDDVVIHNCDSCGSKQQVKFLGVFRFNDPSPTGVFLCNNCRESLKDMLIDDSEEDDY